MRKQVTFLVAALMVFAITLTAFFAGCGGGDSGGGGNNGSTSITVPKVEDLPAFPAGASPATTDTDEDSILAILAALAQSGAIQSVYECMNSVVDKYGNSDYYGKGFAFTDKKDDNNTIIVSASDKRSYKVTDNYHYGWYNDKGFTTNDYERYSSESTREGKLIQDITRDITRDIEEDEEDIEDITEGNVTIFAGCMIGERHDESEDVSVTKAGTIENARVRYSASDESQYALGFTVKTSLGSVKIILDVTYIGSISGSNAFVDDVGSLLYEMERMGIRRYSGSLNVYGKDDTLLKTVSITNEEKFRQVQDLIGIRQWYWYY